MSQAEEGAVSKKALSVTHNRSSGCGVWFLYVFCGAFAVGGMAMCYFMLLRPLGSVIQARSWVETPCTIVSSRVERHDGDDSDTFSIEIEYDYTFDGQAYRGDRYHFMIGSTSGQAGKQAVVDAHPVGRRTICYVDPSEPSEAVLERRWVLEMLWGLFSLPFLAVGLGLPWAIRRGNRKKAAKERGEAVPGFDSESLQFRLVNEGDDGPVTLKPESSSIGLFVVSICVCLFWNGIVSFMVREMLDGWSKGNPDWVLTLFSIPFIAAGAGLIAWVIYAFAALFNPRPTLTLSRRQIPLGEQAHVNWSFRGNSSAIRQLTLTLKGVEKATYRRGTDTHTDTATFYERVLFQSDQAYDIANGEAEIEIPVDSMHTFQAGNNEISWSLHVAGEIPLRPDVNESFPMVVLPQRRNER